MSGVLGNSFVAILPLVNTGSGAAGDISITSVSLGDAALVDPVLPQSLGSAAASDFVVLDLKFGAAKLGTAYTLAVRGTYRSGSQTLGFAVTQPLATATPNELLKTELEHWVACDAVSEKFASLLQLNQDADSQALLEFIRGRPEFVSSGIDAGSSSIWASFADGERLVVGNTSIVPWQSASGSQPNPSISPPITINTGAPPSAELLAPSTSASSPAAAQPIFDLPVSPKAHILSGVGFPAAPFVATQIAQMLTDQNYAPAKGAATVEGLKQVAGDGVFYLVSHGGVSNGAYVIGPATRTPPSYSRNLPLT
jgi:hypothetical protein